MVKDQGLLEIRRHLLKIADTTEASPNRRSGNMMIAGGTVTEIHKVGWEDGTADVAMSDEFSMEARLDSPIRLVTTIGTVEATSFSVIHSKEEGRRSGTDLSSIAARLRRISRVMERAVAQDPDRLRRRERAAAITASILSAALTAHVEDAEAGRLVLPGPHLPFGFEPVRRDGGKARTHPEFDVIVERASRIVEPMTALSATLRGENVEVRMGACSEIIHQADPMEAIRILSEVEGWGSL